ncbi:MAG: hypothetical protein K0S32_940 [Bacteroidetes bacterium]|jgi:hypothetical protein|nr:hypothetical protein [Bacteroidota bacterium]
MSLKKIARFLIITVVVIFLLVFLLQVFAGLYLNDKIKHILQERVVEETHGKYAVTLEASSVNIFGRSLTLKKVGFVPVKQRAVNEAAFCLIADEIKLSGINAFSFLADRCLCARKLSFTNPVIVLFQENEIPNKDSLNERVTLFKVISKELDEISIDNIQTKNALFKIYGHGDKPTEVLSSNENEIELKTFLVNENTDRQKRNFTAKRFIIRMKSCVYRTPGGLYTLKGKNLYASYFDSLLTIDSLDLQPNFKKEDFGEKAGKQVSRVKLKATSIRFHSMNVGLFFEKNWFIANGLEIGQFDLNVHRDKNMELEKIRKPSLQRIIFNIPFKIKLDTIRIKHSEIVYEHLAEGNKEPGIISFNELSGTVTGMNNDTSLLAKNGDLKIKADALFMNKGKLHAFYNFPLTTSKEVFFCSGTLSAMPLSAVNQMLEKTANASIRKGQLDLVSFSFRANESHSKGKMKFMYHDLKMDLLDKDNKGEKKRFASFMANVLIKNSNPEKKGEARITDIYYERYPYKFFLYYTWKSLQSGIMPAVGVNSETMLKKSDNK